MESIFDMKQSLYDFGKKVKDLNDQIVEKAASPEEDALDKVKALTKARDEYQTRYDTMKEQLDRREAEEKVNVKNDKNVSPVEKKNQAFAKLVKATMANESVGTDVYEALGDNDTTGGNKFLPKTVSTEVITAPEEKNPLRDISVVTQIPNLEIPRLTFTLDDDDFIEDTETAKEIEAKGDNVVFGRNKFKVFVGMSETVLRGSAANLTSYVQQALTNGVITKERKVAFNPAPSKENEKHMSFYDSSVGIKSVSGADLYEAITNAIADLHESYRDNAQIVMTYADYQKIIKTLANGSTTLYSAQPEQVLGKPVIFTDAAVKPIVGDFSYSQYNYDLDATYEHDKDVKTGIDYFVLTAWMDHQIKLASAFRIADVAGGSGK